MGQVKALVENGWVTLGGVVEYAFQRAEVERIVRNVRGVLGVTNNIEVKPRGAEATTAEHSQARNPAGSDSAVPGRELRRLSRNRASRRVSGPPVTS